MEDYLDGKISFAKLPEDTRKKILYLNLIGGVDVKEFAKPGNAPTPLDGRCS